MRSAPSRLIEYNGAIAIDAATKRKINEAAVRRYFSTWDPTWRWILILGLRDMRANLPRLAQLAAGEMGNDTWTEETYAYGPLALGVTAAAVNEAAQHCEDLFALLSFLRDPTSFSRRMGGYAAGKVIRLASDLKTDSEAALARRFCVPALDVIKAGMARATNPEAAVDAARDGRARLVELVREVVEFYETYEFFHVQYKHGLKLALNPFGRPTADAIAERKKNVSAPVFALSNEDIGKMLKRPQSQQAMMLQLDTESQAHISELVKNRDFLRLQMAGPEVELDQVVKLSWTVSRLLRLAAGNRIALGELDEDGQQSFSLPGPGETATIEVRIEPKRAVELKDVQ